MNRPLLAAVAVLALAGCQDRYGRIDPLRTGLAGAAVGGGAGLIGGVIAQDQRSRKAPHGYGYSHGYQAPYYGHGYRGYQKPSYRHPGYGYHQPLPPMTRGMGRW